MLPRRGEFKKISHTTDRFVPMYRACCCGVGSQGEDDPMKTNHKIAIALVAGIAVGGTVIQGLHAQATPPAYVVVDISDITDPEGFKAIPPKAGPETLAPFGGKYIIRTEKITALDGTAPKRFVVIEFDSVEKAKAWKASPSSQEVDAIRNKTTKSSQFLVEGM
jgi:uncharacterized protein (DUF1330 family)